MNCRGVEDLIMAYASGVAIPPEAAAHIAACERCQRLARAIAESQQGAPPPPEQLDQIKAGLLADLKPVTPIAPAGVVLFALLGILVLVAAVGALALGIAGWQALSLLQRIAVFTVLPASAGCLAFSLGRQIVPGSRLVLSPYALVIAVGAVMAGTFATLFHPHAESTFVSTGLVCLRIGLECAVPSGLLSWLVLRRGAILVPIPAGAVAGALAGFSGLTVLEIFCPNLNQLHILAWHWGALLASVTGGMLIGSIAARSRPVRRSS